MNKQCILAVVAAVFSFFIAFGGWFLTNQLLNWQHLNLMNTVRFINIKEPMEIEPGVEPTRPSLSAQEIANILKVWRSDRIQNYHDPYDGQLTMEEAIKAANSGLAYFSDKGILPKEILESDFTRTHAFLYNTQPVREVPVVVAPAPDPAYSFWSVNLSNREVSVQLMLNALTGRIWMADINLYSLDVNFNDVKALDVLDQYEAYLGLSSGGELRSDETYASKSYDNNQIGITVYKKTGESSHYGTLHFSLISAR